MEPVQVPGSSISCTGNCVLDVIVLDGSSVVPTVKCILSVAGRKRHADDVEEDIGHKRGTRLDCRGMAPSPATAAQYFSGFHIPEGAARQ